MDTILLCLGSGSGTLLDHVIGYSLYTRMLCCTEFPCLLRISCLDGCDFDCWTDGTTDKWHKHVIQWSRHSTLMLPNGTGIRLWWTDWSHGNKYRVHGILLQTAVGCHRLVSSP